MKMVDMKATGLHWAIL